MGTLFHGRYNRNELRNFPLADAAGRVAVTGDTLPMDFLADLSLRYPGRAGIPYISGALRAPALASVALACHTDAGDILLGTVTVTRPSSQLYRSINIEPAEPGVGGWVVFGAGAVGDPLRLAFDDPSQTALLPKLARPYRRPPVTSVARAGRSRLLTGHVGIVGAGLVETAQEGERTIVVRLSRGAQPERLAEFLGVCAEGRGGECAPPAIQTINRVAPDADGNIEVVMEGVPEDFVSPLLSLLGEPEGMVLNMPVGLIDICPAGKDLYPALPELPECD